MLLGSRDEYQRCFQLHTVYAGAFSDLCEIHGPNGKDPYGQLPDVEARFWVGRGFPQFDTTTTPKRERAANS